MLTIVPTPIGNLKDITLRCLETLQAVDGIVCEDSRRTSTLLQHFQIKKPLLVLNDFNEKTMFPQIIERLKQGENFALVSDAGTPLIADPGYKLVRQAVSEGIQVESLPGPVAAITALTLSTLPPDKFIFLGYLPEKLNQRKQFLSKLKTLSKSLTATHIAYVAPHKLIKTLEDIEECFGNMEVVLAKELTKIHQQVDKQPIHSFVETFRKRPPKGEYILLFHL